MPWVTAMEVEHMNRFNLFVLLGLLAVFLTLRVVLPLLGWGDEMFLRELSFYLAQVGAAALLVLVCSGR